MPTAASTTTFSTARTTPAVGQSAYEVHELDNLLRGNANALVAAPVLVWILNSFEERLTDIARSILIDEAWAAVKIANEWVILG